MSSRQWKHWCLVKFRHILACADVGIDPVWTVFQRFRFPSLDLPEEGLYSRQYLLIYTREV